MSDDGGGARTLELRGLTRRFRDVVALDVSFSVEAGEMVALGDASWWQVGASTVISVAATAALIPVATTIYSRALLRTCRVRIRQVLRGREA